MGACDSEAARKGPPYKRGRTASYGAGLPCAARRRLVLNSAGYAKSNRLFVINFDPASGALSIDDRFRDPGSTRAGIDLTGKSWPHGFSGKPVPNGTVFSR
jgi:hypothetical protein